MKHQIIFSKGRIFLFGTLEGHSEHKHYYIQIFVSKENNCSDVNLEIIHSNTPHSLKQSEGVYFSILLDPLSSEGKLLRTNFPNNNEIQIMKLADSKFLDNLSDNTSVAEIKIKFQYLLQQLLNEDKTEKTIDSRIMKAIELINRSDSLDIRAEKIYREAGLSESQFNLLFKRDIGIPFRRYLLWEKFRIAVNAVLRGEDFTNAAQSGFFSDSSHMARTFKENTGFSLSTIFKNRRIIQVHIESPV